MKSEPLGQAIYHHDRKKPNKEIQVTINKHIIFENMNIYLSEFEFVTKAEPFSHLNK